MLTEDVPSSSIGNRYLKSYSSLTHFKNLLDQSGVERTVHKHVSDTTHADTILNAIKSVAGLFALGRYKIESIDQFVTNRYFQESLEIGLLPSSKKLLAELNENKKSILAISAEVTKGIFAEPLGQYVSDFNSNMGQNSLKDVLFGIHTITTSCLKQMALSGVTGELFNDRSLFNEKTKSDLERTGYAIIEGVLSEDEVTYLRDLILKISELERQKGCAYIYGGTEKCQRIYNLLNKHERFRDLIQRPLILEIMEHVFARDTLHDKYILSSWHSNIIGEGGEASILHVDAAVPEPLPPWPIRFNINYMLDDFTFENGATLCLPGSHKLLRKPKKEDQFRPDLVPMLAPKGSLGIWNGHLWHKSGTNNTNRKRIALLGCFAASHLREMSLEEDHLRVIDQETVSAMSPKLQRLIGVGYGVKKGASEQHKELEDLKLQ